MFKKTAIVIGLLIYVGVILVVVGVLSLNNKNWINYKTEFLSEKSSVIHHYIDSKISGLENAVFSNAYWTEALVEIESGNDEWIAENATTYITDMELFEVDYIVVGNESLSFIQESGLELGNEILDLEEVQDSLINNEVHKFIIKSSVGYALVLSSPWMDNDENNPTGVYVAMTLLDETLLNDLKNVLGGHSVIQIKIMPTNQLTQTDMALESNESLFDLHDSIILTTPISDSDYSIAIGFEMQSIHNIFHQSRNYILTIVMLSASLVYVLILFSVKMVEKWIRNITSNIKDISEGNYDIYLEKNGPVVLEEINDLTDAVNRMSMDLKSNILVIDNNYLEMADVIIKAVEINDQYTSHHNIAVGEYAKIIAHQIGYADMQVLELAAKLHDIGKISIPGTILNKPGKLTDEEFEIIKTHPIEGYNIVHHIEYFSDIRLGILNHHERWDGTGYPSGLKGDEIPLMAQIISIADVYDAITSDRAYRLGMSHEEAIKLIVSNSGSMFNPILVEAFLIKKDLFEKELEKRRSIK